MTHAPMPESLLASLKLLAQSRNIAPPSNIIRWAEIERVAKKPKRPRLPYWMRDE